MIAQMILFYPRGKRSKATPGWQARTSVRVGNKWSCRHRSLSASSRGYIYTELKLVMYPKKSSRGGLVLVQLGRSSSAAPGHRVSSDYSWFWSPRLGSGYYDTRDSPARVSRMSLARHRRLTWDRNMQISKVDGLLRIQEFTSYVVMVCVKIQVSEILMSL